MNAPVDPLPDRSQYQNTGQSDDPDKLIPWADLARITAILTALGTLLTIAAGRIYPYLSEATQNRIKALEYPFFVLIAWAIICLLLCFFTYLYRYLLWDKRDAALEALRERTAQKEGVGDWYKRTVERALAVTDKFFGDAGKADQSWQPRAFGLLREPAPLWTAASYDKCLMIALIYPIFCIYAVWALTGDAGDAGRALGLIDGWGAAHTARIAMVIAIAGGVATFVSGSGLVKGVGLSVAIGAGLAIAVDSSTVFVLGLGAFTVIVASFIASSFRIIVPIFGSLSLIISVAFVLSIFFAGVSAFVFPWILIILFINLFSIDGLYKYHSFLHWVFALIFFLLCLSMPLAGSTLQGWSEFGAVLYFVPLLTLINAPFDWAALGVTRALLRKGLEQGGLLPLWWGFVDLVVSLATIAVLGAAVIFFTQIFNAATLLGGATKVVFDPLTALRAIADPATRYDPRYYWLYLMLLTTQLPAILNLAAGFLAIFRTAGFGTSLLAPLAAQGAATRNTMRLWLAGFQAVQVAFALTLGFVVLVAIYYGILFKIVEPLAGGTMLSWFLSIAEANLPAYWFGVQG